jgi:hypothetical protein
MEKKYFKKGEAKNFSFNYDLTNLPEYSSYGDDMLIKAFLGLTLPKYSSVRPNLKGTTEKVGFVTNDVILQDLACGFDPTGDTVQNVVTVNLCNKKVNQQLCPYSLYDTYLSQFLSDSNFQETIPFEEVILTDIANRTANQIELQLWRNTTATGATPYNGQCFDGVLALVTTGNGATHVAYTAATASNGLDVFTSYYQAIPENVLHRDDLVIYCGYADFRALVSSMRNNSYINLFDFSKGELSDGASDWGVILPATNVRVIPTQGLTGQGTVIAGPAQYIMVGMNAEMMTQKAMYDPFEDIVKLNLHATYGVGVFSVDSFVVAN